MTFENNTPAYRTICVTFERELQ